jgi:hypothetical protein
MEGVKRNVDKGRCPLRLGEEDVKHILLETKQWRMNLIHDKWLSMNKEVICIKTKKIQKKAHIQNLGKYLDIVKIKWFNKIKEM